MAKPKNIPECETTLCRKKATHVVRYGHWEIKQCDKHFLQHVNQNGHPGGGRYGSEIRPDGLILAQYQPAWPYDLEKLISAEQQRKFPPRYPGMPETYELNYKAEVSNNE